MKLFHRAPDPVVPVDDPAPPNVPHPAQDDPVPDHNPS
jgi:hypothetical protein